MGGDAPPAAPGRPPAHLGAPVRQGGTRIHRRNGSWSLIGFGANFEWEIWGKVLQCIVRSVDEGLVKLWFHCPTSRARKIPLNHKIHLTFYHRLKTCFIWNQILWNLQNRPTCRGSRRRWWPNRRPSPASCCGLRAPQGAAVSFLTWIWICNLDGSNHNVWNFLFELNLSWVIRGDSYNFCNLDKALMQNWYNSNYVKLIAVLLAHSSGRTNGMHRRHSVVSSPRDNVTSFPLQLGQQQHQKMQGMARSEKLLFGISVRPKKNQNLEFRGI